MQKKKVKDKGNNELLDPRCLQHWSDQDAKFFPQSLSASKFDKILLLSPEPDETNPDLRMKWTAKTPVELGALDCKIILPFGYSVTEKKFKRIPAANSSHDECFQFGCYY